MERREFYKIPDIDTEPSILIVEDFDDIRDLMRLLIGVLGVRVFEATDGREAVDRAREFSPDLMLMDLAMPAFDGIQTTRELKNVPELSNIPIVAITSHNYAFHDDALAAGYTKVVDKPVTVEEMEKLLVGLLSD